VLLIAGRPGPAFRLDQAGENVLGRGSGSLVTLADRLASRQHAAIRFDAEAAAWMLRDLDSRNGTWLDGVRITSALLAPGCQIRIGTTDLVFQPAAVEPKQPAATAQRVVRRGPPAEFEGTALSRAAAGGEEARWPMLLYQAAIRLLAAGARRDVVCTTLELAAEFTAAASFAWLEPAADGSPLPACVVPPGSSLTARVSGSAWSDATAGLAIWVAAEATGEGDLACVPLVDGGRIRAVLAAAGSIRDADFDLLLALASLAAAAIAGRERGALRPADTPALAGTTDPLDEAEALAAEEEPVVDGTLALSVAELELLRGGRLADWLATAETLELEAWERLLAVEALRRTGGSVPEAAALLGVSRATLYRRLGAYGLTRPNAGPAAT
jgi:hypothetical protein